jgi:16S rRNA (adenine1518-N6/adenine1519-N6)-dimethyltransferase
MTHHRPRKRLGQHFLHDPGVIQRILDAMDPTPSQHVVEIGPGLGALTRDLLRRVGRLDVVELDRDVVPPLRAACAGLGELVVHEADAVRFDFAALRGTGPPLRVVGNLPYNVSTPLLFHLLDQMQHVADMHVMLQKEVVRRMAAPPGNGEYGRLSVMIQYQCRVEPLFNVSPGAFRPPPRVDSAVVRLLPHTVPPVRIAQPALFKSLVTQAFCHRRKTLRNALRGILEEDQIKAEGVDPGVRPEVLSLEVFARLANAAAVEHSLETLGRPQP